MRSRVQLIAGLVALSVSLLAAPAPTPARAAPNPNVTKESRKDDKRAREKARVAKAADRLQRATARQAQLSEELGLYRAQRRSAKRRLEVLRVALEDLAEVLARAEREHEEARVGALGARAELDAETARYVSDVTVLSFGDGIGAARDGETSDTQLFELIAGSRSPADAPLIYATARTLLDDRQGRVDRMRTLSRRADQFAERAAWHKLTVQTSLREQEDLHAETVALTGLLDTRISSARGDLDTQRRRASRALRTLLRSGTWVAPIADLDAIDAPVGVRVVAHARRELALGVQELPAGSGSNEAPAIARYRSAVRVSWAHTPWCAYFVSYLLARSGVPAGPQGTGFAAVTAMRAWMTRQDRFFSSGDEKLRPQPGDVVFWAQHVGIVEAVDPDDPAYVYTIEGNSSDRVKRNRRPIAMTLGFARPGDESLGERRQDTTGDYTPNATT